MSYHIGITPARKISMLHAIWYIYHVGLTKNIHEILARVNLPQILKPPPQTVTVFGDELHR